MSRFLALVAVAALTCNGCGSGSASLHGTVKIKGKLLSQGTVSVTNGEGFFEAVPIQPDGTYRVENCPTGTLKIGVESPNPQDLKDLETERKRAEAAGMPMRGKASAPLANVNSTSWIQIPSRYAIPDDSGLTASVSRGDNEHNIELE